MRKSYVNRGSLGKWTMSGGLGVGWRLGGGGGGEKDVTGVSGSALSCPTLSVSYSPPPGL